MSGSKAALHITGLPRRNRSVQEKITFAIIEGDAVVLRSPLDAKLPLNDHLVWLWGVLKFNRSFLKNLASEGAQLIFKCSAPKGKVRILPNASEMLHLLGAELVLVA